MSMKEPDHFRLLGAMVLVVAIAFGFAWLRSPDYLAQEPIMTVSGLDYVPDQVAQWAQYAIPFLVILSPCIVVLQLIRYRRRFQCFWRQAGTVACAAASFVLFSSALIDLTHEHMAFLVDGQGGLSFRPRVICSVSWLSFLDISRGIGLAIAVMWTYMRVTGLRERSTSTLDLLGKAPGWTWILIALLPRQA